MARKLEVELVANITRYSKGLAKAAEETKLFSRQVENTSRHIGRSVAFATGGFVAFAGATEFLRSSIDAARDAGVVQRQLAAQMKASGESFKANQAAIEQAGLSLEKFGFTSEDSAKALTVLERGTGSITKSIGLQGLAANLARAKNLDLASAANVLAKVFGGQETALRRAVPGLEKTAHGTDLLREANRKLAGQARAGTTDTQRFHAALHDTEVIIGTTLLPTMNKLLMGLSEWLAKTNRSGQLQRDLNQAVGALTGGVRVLQGALHGLNQVTGSTKHSLELLLGSLVAFKTAKFASAVANILASIGGIGTAAKTSTGEVRGLRAALIGLSRVGPILIPIAIVLERKAIDKAVSGLLDKYGLPGGTNQLSLRDFAANKPSFMTTAEWQKIIKQNLPAFRRAGLVYGPPAPANLGAPRAGTDVRAADAVRRTAGARDIPPPAVVQQISSITEQAAKTAISTRADAQRTAIAAARDYLRKVPELGYTPVISGPLYSGRLRVSLAAQKQAQYATPLRIQLAESRAEALNQSGAFVTALKAARAAARKALHSGKLSLQAQKDAWDEISSLNDQIKNTAKGSADTYKAQRARAVQLAHAQGSQYQFAGAGVTINGGVHLHGVQDMTQFEDQLVKRARARPQVRRGAR